MRLFIVLLLALVSEASDGEFQHKIIYETHLVSHILKKMHLYLKAGKMCNKSM